MAAANDDPELLRRYAEERTEDAFVELVRRHIDLVHSAALRQVGGNAATAADVTQSVFTELARQAGRLARHPALTGWLYTTTRRIAAHAVRGEARRERREQEAHAMQELLRGPAVSDLDWDRLRPVLDAAMHDLGETDRLAVLLRHFEQRPLAEVGARLGLGENAARMRVERALDKLRAKLAKRGVTSTASALAIALSGQAVTAAPATLASVVTASALAAAATTTTSTFGLLTLMASTQLKLAAVAVALVAAGTMLVLQHQAARRLSADNADLQRRVVQLTDEAQTARQTTSQNAEELARLRQPQTELLRLRGEVGQLRQQLASASRPAAKPATTQERSAEEEAEVSRQFAIRRMNEAKLLVMGFHLYASDHDDKLPDSLEVAASRLDAVNTGPEQAETVKALRTEDFEIQFRGLLKDISNPASAIVLREREAWQRPKGGWARTYGFADGHSEVHGSDDGDFSAWEAQHQVQPATENLPGATGK